MSINTLLALGVIVFGLLVVGLALTVREFSRMR